MKIRRKGATAFICLLMSATMLQAQNNSSTVRTGVISATPSQSSISVRAKSLYEKPELTPADIPWMRVIYRSVDLTKEKNMPLYYPEDATEDQENLFRMIIRLLADNKIPAYEYLDGREIFTDQYKVNVKDVLDRFHILYQTKEGRTTKNTKYIIEDSDIPCNEVLTYYMREKWMFDQRNSGLTPVIEAICPVLHRTGDFGGEAVKYPMFWIKYDDLRPYMAQQYIITSNENNIQNYTFDDFFKMRMYDGEIYKTTNLRNMSLMQLYPTQAGQDSARAKIEDQLNNFEKNLWVKNPVPAPADSIKMTSATKKTSGSSVSNRSSRGTKQETSTRSSRGSSSNKSVKAKSSSGSTKSAPVRSVRRTR